VATNRFSQADAAILSPYTRAVTITPNNNEDIAELPRAIMCHSAGHGNNTYSHVTLMLAEDTTGTLVHFENGTILPLRARRIMSTGTDADAVVTALY
jgi:hypothetical protein